ncbi:MAG: hypothetical protein ACREQV_01145 [Candidatus Binatia bacterium]
MAMKAIRDSGGSLGVFRVGHVGNGRWLDSYFGSPGHFFLGGDLFVFRRPRK